MYCRGQAKTTVLAIVVLIAAGCGRLTEQAGESRTPKDSWYHEPAAALLWELYDAPLDRTQFAPVQQSGRAAAEELLRETPFRRIDAEQAKVLLGKELTSEDGGELYLLRGLCLEEATGNFLVYARDGNVLVHHGCLGRHRVPMQRKAVVALLPTPPTELYVTCSMAE
jgi:hypothetical protein